MMTYDETIAYLYGFIDYEKITRYVYDAETLNLDRMRALLGRVGDPHRDLRCVHIAGTNGKGSTAAMTAAILRAGGYRAGLYTSPHLITFRERIRQSGRAISPEDLCVFAERIREAIEEGPLDAAGALTFFEVWTALAFLCFAEKGADPAVIEVGMGGRFDATNVIEPLAAVITPVDLDHVHKLGATPGQIAYEKAGIIKEGVPVITAGQMPEVLEVIRSVSGQRGARCVQVGQDVTYERVSFTDKGQVLRIEAFGRVYDDLFIPLLGPHQVANAALAVGAVGLIEQEGVRVPAGAVAEGLRTVKWPGRLQVAGRDPWIVLDGSCNVQGARQTCESVREGFSYKRLVLVLGVCKDKDVEGVYRALEPVTDVVVLAQADNPRALTPDALAQQIGRTGAQVVVSGRVPQAVEQARSLADPEDMILITGSLYVVGEAMGHLGLDAETI